MTGILMLGSVWGAAFIAVVGIFLWETHRREKAEETDRRRARIRESLWEQEFGPLAQQAREIRDLPTAPGYPEFRR